MERFHFAAMGIGISCACSDDCGRLGETSSNQLYSFQQHEEIF